VAEFVVGDRGDEVEERPGILAGQSLPIGLVDPLEGLLSLAGAEVSPGEVVGAIVVGSLAFTSSQRAITW
jgi:hypothetical protein